MDMIRHQAESQYPMTESFNTFLHKKVKPVSVLIIEEYVLACITTKYYMIKRAGIMYAWFTCHVWSVSSSYSLSSLTPYSPHSQRADGVAACPSAATWALPLFSWFVS
jgi:hypothetical protein